VWVLAQAPHQNFYFHIESIGLLIGDTMTFWNILLAIVWSNRAYWGYGHP